MTATQITIMTNTIISLAPYKYQFTLEQRRVYEPQHSQTVRCYKKEALTCYAAIYI